MADAPNGRRPMADRAPSFARAAGLPALSKLHRANMAAEERVLSTASGTFLFMHSQGLCVAEANAASANGGADVAAKRVG